MKINKSYPDYTESYENANSQTDDYIDSGAATYCEMCGKEVSNNEFIRINGILLCLRCIGNSTVDSICDITETPVEYFAECIAD